MTIEAMNKIIDWCYGKPLDEQKILKVAIRNSMEKEEEIDLEVIDEIIKITNKIIESRDN